MFIIGEKINSASPSVRIAIETRDVGAIQMLAKRQAEAGADYIDVNAGMFFDDEPRRLVWLIDAVQSAVNTPLCIDTPNPAAMEAGLMACRCVVPILNSLTAEKSKMGAMLNLAHKHETKIIALCMDENGIPRTSGERYTIAKRLIGWLTDAGVKHEDIFIDPLVLPVSTGQAHCATAIETLRLVRAEYPDVHLVCGLSNVSYGLPRRKLLNRAFMVSAMTAGLDCAILDPLDIRLMELIAATEAILGKDENCATYIDKFRAPHDQSSCG